MSTDVVILNVLSAACHEALQMFDKATVAFSDEEPKECYVCIGKHFVFFAHKDMDGLVQGCGRLSYLQISKAITDTSTTRLFLLELDNEGAGEVADDWEGGDRLLISAQHREALLERIGLGWQAELMYRTFQVRKFPQARAGIGTQLGLVHSGEDDLELPVRPFSGYEAGFTHRGYSIFLRTGFTSKAGLGTFTHEQGWEVSYNGRAVVVPGGVELSLYVGELCTLGELEGSRSGQDDLKTVAHTYKQALLENIDQFYITVNGSYMKKMNRTGDIASWEGWEFFIRAKEYVFGCIVMRRAYIPPLCDAAQDIAVLLRCPAESLSHDACEVLLDECRAVADSAAPVAQVRHLATDIIQARLDSLQCTEEAYRWFEGRLGLTPVHRHPAATKFLKSIIKILDIEGQIHDDTILEDPIFTDVPVLHDPLVVGQEMLSDAESLLGDGTKSEREERRSAWYQRISKYLAFCVDGGLLGERFTIGTLLQAMHRGAGEIKVLRTVVEFLLHLMPHGDYSKKWSPSFVSLSQLLHEPERFGKYSFNRSVMRVLLHENHLASEWKRAHRSSDALYESLLAGLLTNDDLGLPLKTLICRQILENTSTNDWTAGEGEPPRIKVLVPALLEVMGGPSLSLTSCATAALVNLSCGKDVVKSSLVQVGVIPMCMRQLKSKDDDLTLYTLYLLVNLTKLPHHRAIVVRNGGVPLLVDILTSSYQNVRKQKILTEIASVVGQLCNDPEIRTVLSDDYPVVLCLLWVNDQAPPNGKLKSKLLFALRQLAAGGQNKCKIGEHAIVNVLEQIAQARPKFPDCLANAILLLLALSSISSNVSIMARQDRLTQALESCGLAKQGQENPAHKFGPGLWEKVEVLLVRIREEFVMGSI